MFDFLRKSQWTFRTAGSVGVAIDIFAVSGGQVILSDPNNRNVSFDYGGAGVGVGDNIKLPKVGKIQFKSAPIGKVVSGVMAPESFPNVGLVYMTEFFPKKELSKLDFQGACIFAEAGGGEIAGYSGTVMLVGIDPMKLAVATASPILSLVVGLAEPKAVISFRGPSIGIQFGGAAIGYVGYMRCIS